MKKQLLNLLFKVVDLETLSKKLIKWLSGLDDKYIDEFVSYVFQKVYEIDAVKDLPGMKKREEVEKAVKNTFNEVADQLIGLAIELAVAQLRTQTGQKRK